MKNLIMALCVGLFCVILTGCTRTEPVAVAVSHGGIKEAKAEVEVGPDGLTVEQRNIKKRLERDNKPGSIKHLYIFSPMSGQCMFYSTVKGKVTSGSKRLTPYTVHTGAFEGDRFSMRRIGIPIKIGDTVQYTGEVLQDDGTYGSSVPYIYFFDVRDQYHQRFVTTCEIHVSDHPLPVKNIVINIEELHKDK
jgi:hypothetical protein